MINDEFSPVICEAIATHAFPKDPVFRQLDKNLFILELYHGATGTFKDFGVSYLTSALETILQMDGKKAILLDATTGELGACMAKAIGGKKLLKSVLLAPKGKLRGIDEKSFVWNGGNIYPIEIDGTEQDCHKIIREIFSNKQLVKKLSLTVANTANIFKTQRNYKRRYFLCRSCWQLWKSCFGTLRLENGSSCKWIHRSFNTGTYP